MAIIKLLIVTNTPPIPTWGGAMTFYRHFVLSGDFEIAVITDDLNVQKYSVEYPVHLSRSGKLGQRLTNTRLYSLIQSIRRIIGVRKIHPTTLAFSREFQPDAVFTVAGSWSWMAIQAQKISKKLNTPLIASFNDWWFYGAPHHPFFAGWIEKKFRKFYRNCDLALCTSEGMQQELGTHPNFLISYPTGAKLSSSNAPEVNKLSGKKTLAFAGNLGEWYGQMLEEIISNTDLNKYNFKIYGSNASWSHKFDQFVRANKIYLGQVSFEELQEAMKTADGLILLMGFGDKEAIIEKTSFKTKFLDYLTFQKPIFLWGPEYCSAYRISEEFDSTARTGDRSVKTYIQLFDEVFQDSEKNQQLLHNSRKMYESRFNPELIHQKLVKKIKELSS